jgi:hypothetical protein
LALPRSGGEDLGTVARLAPAVRNFVCIDGANPCQVGRNAANDSASVDSTWHLADPTASILKPSPLESLIVYYFPGCNQVEP